MQNKDDMFKITKGMLVGLVYSSLQKQSEIRDTRGFNTNYYD